MASRRSKQNLSNSPRSSALTSFLNPYARRSKTLQPRSRSKPRRLMRSSRRLSLKVLRKRKKSSRRSSNISSQNLEKVQSHDEGRNYSSVNIRYHVFNFLILDILYVIL